MAILQDVVSAVTSLESATVSELQQLNAAAVASLAARAAGASPRQMETEQFSDADRQAAQRDAAQPRQSVIPSITALLSAQASTQLANLRQLTAPVESIVRNLRSLMGGGQQETGRAAPRGSDGPVTINTSGVVIVNAARRAEERLEQEGHESGRRRKHGSGQSARVDRPGDRHRPGGRVSGQRTPTPGRRGLPVFGELGARTIRARGGLPVFGRLGAKFPRPPIRSAAVLGRAASAARSAYTAGSAGASAAQAAAGTRAAAGAAGIAARTATLAGGAAAAGLGGVAGPVGIAIAGLLAFYAAATKASYAVGDMAKQTVESKRELAQFSGSMAAVFAQHDARRIERDIRQGEREAPSARNLAESSSRFEDTRSEIATAWDRISNRIQAAMTRMADNWLKASGLYGAAKSINAALDKIEGNTRREITGMQDWMEHIASQARTERGSGNKLFSPINLP